MDLAADSPAWRVGHFVRKQLPVILRFTALSEIGIAGDNCEAGFLCILPDFDIVR
jgi:hypothetical protein